MSLAQQAAATRELGVRQALDTLPHNGQLTFNGISGS